jgi:hypothetical protein
MKYLLSLTIALFAVYSTSASARCINKDPEECCRRFGGNHCRSSSGGSSSGSGGGIRKFLETKEHYVKGSGVYFSDNGTEQGAKNEAIRYAESQCKDYNRYYVSRVSRWQSNWIGRYYDAYRLSAIFQCL